MKKILSCVVIAAGVVSASIWAASNFPDSVSTDSNLYVAVNNCYTTLSVTINASTPTITGSSTASFPSVGYIIIENEVVKYTGKTSGTFTGCTRGADGTAAATHTAGKLIYHSIVADHHNALKEEIKGIEDFFLTDSLVHLATATTRVGINNASPAYTLDVGGAINTNDAITAATSIGGASGSFTGEVAAATLNTGNGSNELFPMDQDVQTSAYPTYAGIQLTYGVSAATGAFSGALTGLTLDTGQGANELYDMDQNVQTTDSPSFVGMSLTYGISAATVTASSLTSGRVTTAGVGGILQDFAGFKYDGSTLTVLGAMSRGGLVTDGTNINLGGTYSISTAPYSTVAGGEGNVAAADSATVGGGYNNWALGFASTIGGGGYSYDIEARQNIVYANLGTIGGGVGNTISSSGSDGVIGGGVVNLISGPDCVVGGGNGNIAGGDGSVVAGGLKNTSTGYMGSSVGGGLENVATGAASTIPGGQYNLAQGSYTFVAGYRGHATHHGSMIFADYTASDFNSSAENEFAIRASGGFRVVGGSGTVDGLLTGKAGITSTGTITGNFEEVAVATQTIAEAGTVAADQCGGVKRISSDGVVTSSTTTTFASPTSSNQCRQSTCNVGAQNITLDYNAGFLSFGAADVLLTPNDCVDVAFDGVVWRQIAPVSVN
jgi:hypothetical protein